MSGDPEAGRRGLARPVDGEGSADFQRDGRGVMRRTFSMALGLALVLAPSLLRTRGAAAFQNGAVSPGELTLQERQVAKEVSEARLHADRLLTKSSALADRSYLTKMELLTDKGSEARNALVQHYRYKDDTTILTTVDLATKAVVRTEQVPHLSTPLSQEELNEAIRLASA